MRRGAAFSFAGAVVAAVAGFFAFLGIHGFTGYGEAMLSYGLQGINVEITPIGWAEAWEHFHNPEAFVPAIIAVVGLFVLVMGIRSARRSRISG